MTKFKTLLLSCFALLSLISCFEDQDDNLIANTDINDFVWKGMNTWYLYNSDIPNLSNDRFGINGIDNRYEKTAAYSTYLDEFSSPEGLFESLVFEPSDPFSVLVPNYFDILNAQQGTILTNGIEFGLYFVPGSDTELFGAITLVLNNSVADNLGLTRGLIFRGLDGTNLNINNYISLLNQNAYTLNFADYNANGTPEVDDDTIIPNNESIALTKATYTENPIHIADVFSLEDTNVAYLMYNGFTSNFDTSLNDVFSTFQASGAQELILDLRYNGGGSIQTAVYLASMITGQFNGQIFSKLFYNNNQENLNRNYTFTNTLSNNAALNSLGLNKVYVLTSARSASASELIINSLSTYIDVIHIGDTTSGKTQANRLIFDSPNFDTDGINIGHTYAMIPLIANSVNSNDALVPATGLIPDINYVETPGDLGVLGTSSDPLFARAIVEITADGRPFQPLINQSLFRALEIPKVNHNLDGLMFED